MAFRQAAKKYHPDLNHGDGADKKFKEIHTAYAILSNALERKLYDESLLSPKVPKDVFTTPKPTYTYTQTARPTQTKPTEEELRKQAEIRRYRKHLIIQAIVKVVLYALGGLLIGYLLISLGQFLTGQKLKPFSLAQLGGILAGLILGFIWSIDRYFKIETFISKPLHRKMFKHFRTAAFALAFTYLATFLWSLLIKTGLPIPSLVTIIMVMLFILGGATFASDGEMRNRIRTGKILELFVIAWHNFLIGLGGLVLGVVIGLIFYLITPEIDYIYLSALFGFIFTVLLGSVAPEGLGLLTEKINQTLKSLIYVVLLGGMFLIGTGIGFLLGRG